MVPWQKHLLMKQFIEFTLFRYWLIQWKLHSQLENAVYNVKTPFFNTKI
jgi:hypothetical protein